MSLSGAAHLVLYLTAGAFITLGVLAGLEWRRSRSRATGYLALSLIFLSLTTVVTRVQDLLGYVGFPTGLLATIFFLVSGYLVTEFRNALLPLSGRAHLAARVLFGLALVLGVMLEIPPVAAALGTGGESAAGSALIACWAILVGEPIYRFWAASRTRQRVQRARLRGLSVGFAVLIAIALGSAAGGSAAQMPAFVLVSQLLAIAMVPVIYVSFTPPRWLRRQWRAAEEDDLRAAIQDLLLFSRDRVDLAERAVNWALRLVGAEAGLLTDADGAVLAVTGMRPERAAEVVAMHAADPGNRFVRLPGASDQPEVAIVVPVHLEEGVGVLATLAGPFTPVFGSDEVVQLEGYASSVAAGLQRTRVTERLTAMERTKTQFLNLASHELRGPLTVLRGYLSMLGKGGLGSLNEVGERVVPVMESKANEMHALVEQMIEAARLEDGHLRLRIESADLAAVVRAVAEQAMVLTDAAHPIRTEASGDPIPVEVDVERIQTIVGNLIDNAIKYSPGGGEVACVVSVRGDQASVAVTDRGLGVAASDLATLFTRFGRVTTPATSHIGGTGLGLYLSRELARLHGGDIEVQSGPGEGSTFTLTIPLAAQRAGGESRSTDA